MRAKTAVAALLASGVVLAIPAAAIAAPPADDKVKVKTTLKGETKAKGSFQAKINGDTLCYKYNVKKLQGATDSHIHFGVDGVDGPIAVTITEGKECLLAVSDAEDTEATLSQSELAALKADPSRFYVDAHSEDFPLGAIRGQLR